MLSWAVYREGALERWMRREVEALLRPYRQTLSGHRGTVRGAARKGVRKGLIRKEHVRS
jgi:hypothetical protein